MKIVARRRWLLVSPLALFLGVKAQEGGAPPQQQEVSAPPLQQEDPLAQFQEQYNEMVEAVQQRDAVIEQVGKEKAALESELGSVKGSMEGKIKEAVLTETQVMEHEIKAIEMELSEMKGKNSKQEEEIKSLKKKAKEAAAASKKESSKKEETKAKKTEESSKVVELNALLSKSSEELSTCESEKKEVNKLLEEKSTCAGGDVEKIGFSVDVESTCERCTVDLTLFTKLFFIFYDNVYRPNMAMVSESLNFDSYTISFYEIYSDIQTEATGLFAIVWAEMTSTYSTYMVPAGEEVLKFGKQIYKEYELQQYLGWVVDFAEQWEIQKNIGVIYESTMLALNELFSTVIVLTKEHVFPAVTYVKSNLGEKISAGDVFDVYAIVTLVDTLRADAFNFVRKPFQFSFFEETVEFKNGMLDAGLLLVVSVFAVYMIFIIGKFAFAYLLTTFFYCVKLVFSLFYKLVTLAFSLVTFVLKIAMCCGCCGYCFSATKPKVTGKEIVTTKQAKQFQTPKKAPLVNVSGGSVNVKSTR